MLNNLLNLFLSLLQLTTINEIGQIFWSILIIITVFTILRQSLRV